MVTQGVALGYDRPRRWRSGEPKAGTIAHYYRGLLIPLLISSVVLGCGAKSVPSPPPPVVPEKPTNPEKKTASPAKTKQEEVRSGLRSQDAAVAESASVADVVPQQIFRPDDQRQPHNVKKLAEVGIRCFESKRLKLYTDIDPQVAATLPQVIDQAYEALEEYFGPLPPDRARSDFQMTGYLIGDDSLFRDAGLIPEDLPRFEHGRHRRNEFWMREQKYDYYRRHLLIHEATHCFMTIMPDVDAPVWYMEGMAECFGTHRIDADGTMHFRVMPTSPEESAGAGRITLIRSDVAEGKPRTISDIMDLRPEEFLKNEHYAWSWGLCTFLDTHPRYRERFRSLGRHLQRRAFPAEFFQAFNADAQDMSTEWMLFAQNLQYGYDTQRAAIEFKPGSELSSSKPRHEVEIHADRGWQSTEVLMKEGQRYEITATGRFELAQQPKPWVSEAQGISFRYFDGKPLGLLLGCLRSASGEASDLMLRVEPMGRGRSFTGPATGTLYLRLNDEWNSLEDNRGQVKVEVKIGEQ